MRTILIILRKEFLQIFRNKTMLPIIFVLPLVQMLILVFAATFELKHINLCVVDNDLSSTSRKLINKFDGSPFFNISQRTFSIDEAQSYLKQNKADIIINIPTQFERRLVREDKAKIQVLVNAINGTAAGVANAYVSTIIAEYNKQVMDDLHAMPSTPIVNIQINYSYWYNPELNYKVFMLPGILVILVTIIGMFLSSMNVVSEKEIGTIEQINVTPIKKYQFIIGKLIPFWCIGLFELAFGLTIGKLLFHIPIEGSLFVLFTFASLYLLVVLGIGLFLSAISNTQQQVMYSSFFFLILFVLMSGIFTPVESMPHWAQLVNRINPIYYFMRVIRMVLLKGSGFADIANECLSLGIYAVVVLTLAVWRYRKTA